VVRHLPLSLSAMAAAIIFVQSYFWCTGIHLVRRNGTILTSFQFCLCDGTLWTTEKRGLSPEEYKHVLWVSVTPAEREFSDAVSFRGISWIRASFAVTPSGRIFVQKQTVLLPEYVLTG